jgi:hypothetical protein
VMGHAMACHMGHAGRGLFVRYMSHRGWISPARRQERGGLYLRENCV